MLGIPRIGPRAAAVFRIVIGVLVVWLVWRDTGIGYPDRPVVPLTPGAGYGAGRLGVVHWLAQSRAVHEAVYVLTMGSAAAFIAGLFTRVAATAFWISLSLLIAVSLTLSGNHMWGAPLVGLFGIVLTPLGDAWSLDALRRRGAPATRPDAPYGFALWWIGLVLGLAFLAAAYSKLHASGLEWATSGAIKYHFIEDASEAPISWGIWVAGQPGLAVALSAIALVVEAAFILVIFCRRDWQRLAFGVAYLGLHTGFFLFQGVRWWPWWAMGVAFLPWATMSRAIDAARVAAPPWIQLTWAHLTAVFILVASQVYGSTRRVEYEPLLSHYPMYSGTFTSWESFFERKRWTKYQTYRFSAAGTPLDDSGLLTPQDPDGIIEAARALYVGQPIGDETETLLAALQARLRERFGAAGNELDITMDIRRVNFADARIDLAASGLHGLTLQLTPPALTFVAPTFASLVPQPVSR